MSILHGQDVELASIKPGSIAQFVKRLHHSKDLAQSGQQKDMRHG
jgi:hypothetical protein